MKKSVLFSLLGLAVCLFTACSSDNNEGEEPTPPTVSGKKISSVKTIWGGDGSDGTLITLSYDKQGRVNSIKDVSTEKGEIYTANANYNYSNTSIEVKENESGGDSYSYNYTLDDNKRISKAVVAHNNHAETCEYTYDGNGQLAGITTNGGENYSISWHNGNISTVVCTETRNGKTSQSVENYTYTNYSTKNLIGIAGRGVVGISYLDPVLFVQGYFGAYPKNTISTYTRNNEPTETQKYEVDGQGYITKLSVSDGDISTITWE
uniref:DUF4595 domain-containing protein n=1 Tax=Prevotella sp. GTC17259 TaxID=3236795 RepID=A0AB33J2U9_9BACT